MNKLFYTAAAALILLSSCNSCEAQKNDNTSNSSEQAGGIYMGGILRVNEVEAFKSLMPISINEINSFHIGTQVYEGLVKFNQTDLSIIPAVAKSWDISADK